MSILSPAKRKTMLIRLGQQWENLAPGTVCRLVGEPPPDLRTFEPWKGTRAADDLPEIDFARTLELQRVREAPAPPAPGQLGYRDLLARYAWTDRDCERAFGAGLPQPNGSRLVTQSDGRQWPEAVWDRVVIDLWEVRVVEIAAAVTRRG